MPERLVLWGKAHESLLLGLTSFQVLNRIYKLPRSLLIEHSKHLEKVIVSYDGSPNREGLLDEVPIFLEGVTEKAAWETVLMFMVPNNRAGIRAHFNKLICLGSPPLHCCDALHLCNLWVMPVVHDRICAYLDTYHKPHISPELLIQLSELHNHSRWLYDAALSLVTRDSPADIRPCELRFFSEQQAGDLVCARGRYLLGKLPNEPPAAGEAQENLESLKVASWDVCRALRDETTRLDELHRRVFDAEVIRLPWYQV